MSKQTVLFDHQTFEMQKFGGISRYFFELRQKLDCNVKLSLGVTTNHYLKSSGNCSALYLPERPYKWLKGPIKKYNLSVSQKEIRKGDYDIFHPTYYNPYFLDVLPKGKPYVITVHDMNHELFPQYFGNADKMTAWKKETVSNASRIIAISQRTKADLIRFFDVPEEKIDIIYHGIAQEMIPYNGLRLPEKYILYVGDRHGYKNFATFFEAFSRLAHEDKGLHLICTGKAWKKAEIKLFEDSGLSDRIMHIRANDFELGQLYQQARLFVYPSLYEGFGIPILEAYINKCPVALSNASCFPEVAAEAGEYFQPENPDSIYQSIKRLCSDEERRQELINAGLSRVRLFTWEETARKTLETYQKVMNR